MTRVSVQKLNGIPSAHKAELYRIMARCGNAERLLVALYFMSELPNARHQLGDIEAELVKIFPPSLRTRKSPGDYSDFGAAAVRSIFNAETRAVRTGVVAEHHRYWTNVRRGYWRNTELGNKQALEVLREQGLLIEHAGVTRNQEKQELPKIERRYMDVESLDDADEVKGELARDESEGENLLAIVDRILESLPTTTKRAADHASTSKIAFVGVAGKVREFIHGVVDSHSPSRVTLVVELGGPEPLVTVRTNVERSP